MNNPNDGIVSGERRIMYRHIVIKLKHESLNEWDKKVGYKKPSISTWITDSPYDRLDVSFFSCYGYIVKPNNCNVSEAWELLKNAQLKQLREYKAHGKYEKTINDMMITQLSEMECPKLNSKMKEYVALPHQFEEPIRIKDDMSSM